MFGGVGGAYVAQGMAAGLNAIPAILREHEDRRRAQAQDDERIAAWREDRAIAKVDRVRANARQNVEHRRNDWRFRNEQTDRARADATRDEDLEFARAERAESRRRWGVQAAQDNLNARYAPQLMRQKIAGADLDATASRQRAALADMQLNAAADSQAKRRAVEQIDRAFGFVAQTADPSKADFKRLDAAYTAVPDGVGTESSWDPVRKVIVTRAFDERTMRQVGEYTFATLEDLYSAALRAADAAEWKRRGPRDRAAKIVQTAQGYAEYDERTGQLRPLMDAATGERAMAPTRTPYGMPPEIAAIMSGQRTPPELNPYLQGRPASDVMAEYDATMQQILGN